jgi:DNA topoisomerase VI subunit A
MYSHKVGHQVPAEHKERAYVSCHVCGDLERGQRRSKLVNAALQVANLRSDAKFILLVEKDAAFMRLAEDRFYNTYPCIILTAKGQPDVATRLFLRRLRNDLMLPVLALVDSDPYGLKILSASAPLCA